MMLQRSGLQKWRAGVFSRAIVSVSVGLFVLFGIIPMEPVTYLALTALALLHYVFIWRMSPRAGAWLDWVNLVFDLGMTFALLQLSGRTQSPLVILVYLWLFAMITVNARYGELRILVFLSALGWIALALGALGGPEYASYLAVHTMGVLLFAFTSLMLMGERRQGQLDPLTQVLHRGAGLERLAERMHKREPFDIAFVDLKGFKRINDRYGHAVGDEVLCCLAGRLLALVRPQDMVMRYGGDEFLVVGAHGTLEQRIGRVFSDPVMTSQGPIRLAGDHGVVSWQPGQDLGLEALLARADAEMYRMKMPLSSA
ncbi:MAG TPA: GGDEF domain-containing protein [Oceanithermus profundus]|uniref:GGDEF domain-containing protein n=1 Tax=Oceanithermus profundus TaxID=187137 RepID=A0A7C4ZHZ7_9DEIN|nr:GGDEF domain-containing protein [Oceanithermus profundus]